ncbi:MAG: Hpt domain-containing protein [Kiritimatiellae bacterium]|nr:Hpt domain-containing protein [Kiritimatiellia bacterium]
MKACCKAYLAEQFDGDEGVMEEIYSEYRVSMGEKLGEIVLATGRGEWETVDRLAHAVKGNALAVGDQATVDTAIELRGAAKLGDKGHAEECIGRLRALSSEL